jgi:hypothetical protein
MASIRDTLAGLFAKESPSAIQGTPLGNAYPSLAQPEPGLEAPMFSPDDLIGTGIGKAALVGAGKAMPLIAGTFIGESSPLFNKATNKLAQALEAKGLKPEEIWPQTGNVKYVDNKWRQEISDANANALQKPTDAHTSFLEKYSQELYNTPYGRLPFGDNNLGEQRQRVVDLTNNAMQKFEKIGTSLEHPELYTAYSDLKNIPLNQQTGPIRKGSYYTNSPYTQDNTPHIFAEAPNPTELKSVLLHELTHGIQEKEGFAKGGSPELFAQDMQEKVSWSNQQVAEKNAQMNETYKMLEEARANKFNDPSSEKRILALKDRYDKLLDEKLSYVKDAQLDPREEAFKQYQNLGGEAEARLVQSRMNLTPEERLKHFPYAQGKFGLDVPYKDLIVKELLNK